MFMDDQQTLTISLSLVEVAFVSQVCRGIMDMDEFDELAKATARQVQQKLIDAAVMDGKVPVEHLPPPEDEDE